MHIAKPGGSVVVVGSLHHDIVVRADRQPIRGETLMGQEWFPKFGGKGGNQAVAAARLGATVHMIGAVGHDTFGDDLLAGLDAGGVERSLVTRVSAGSGMSVATIDGDGDYAAVVVTGANAQIDRPTIDSTPLFEQAAILLLQNEVPSAINTAAAQRARAAGARVIWNAAPMREDVEGLIDLVDLLVLNAIEAEQICGKAVATLDDAAEAAEVIAQTRAATVVVTAGAAGCAWANSDSAGGRLVAKPVRQAQAHGAGDVFCGALAARLTIQPFEDSLSFASEAAFRHVSGLPLTQEGSL